MKMPRSQSENENVQFVQELAEVDGPFESPININFRDLTKLELPALAWNRGDARPKKMKITNTGHTVIISGKWKSERPYLTGGPLTGKYVFSQIHFHWGHDNMRGSEHQVCGEGFPLEMHVAHFKTEYLTQECALREKDGMVVVVYLFKLQEEPNSSLKKIINLLPCVKQASTSHAIDPRPILSLCNPFTEDYFMYWGSVVTSTCAHILLWVICREPFGISRDQVNEFRKILDLSQQPISRNSRDIQPLHKRNVFHVNASKNLDEPLLPVKRILGCYCRGSEDNVSYELKTNCTCQLSHQNQEEVEGGNTEYQLRNHCKSSEGTHNVNERASGCFPNQTIVVQTATVHSVSIVLKRFGSDPVNQSCPNSLHQTRSQDESGRLTSQSCCFFSTSDSQEVHPGRKIRDRKRPFNSLRAFSQIMSSLEALKTHTFKKLREIDSINQEIKGIKPLFHDVEDMQWLRKIEKMMAKKKGFTLKTSHGCLKELKKLARECNFDKFFDSRTLPETDNEDKVVWITDGDTASGKTAYYTRKEDVPTKNDSSDRVKYPHTTQRLIQSFFEDIKESDDSQETPKKNPSPESFCDRQTGNTTSVSSVGKGYITQNMFKLGNLGDRFFTEVTTEDVDMNKEQTEDEKSSEKLLVLKELNEQKSSSWSRESQKLASEEPEPEKMVTSTKGEPLIPLHRANVSIAISRTSVDPSENLGNPKHDLFDLERILSLESLSDRKLLLRHRRRHKLSTHRAFDSIYSKKLLNIKNRELLTLASERLMRVLERKAALQDVQLSSSNPSTESMETPSMIIAKFRKRMSRRDVWPYKKPVKISPKICGKLSCKKFEGYYIERKNKHKKARRQKRKTWRTISSGKDWRALILNPKMKSTKFKLQIQSTTSNTTTASDLENPISPERKKLRLENKKLRSRSSRETKFFSDDELTEEETKKSPQTKLPECPDKKSETPGQEKQLEETAEVSKPPEDHPPNGKEPEISLKPSEGPEKSLEPNEGPEKSPKPSEVPLKTSSRTSPVSPKKIPEPKARREPEVVQRSCKSEIPKPEARTWRRLATKNKSLSNVATGQRISGRFSQVLQAEHLDDRRKANKEIFEFKASKQSKESNTVQSMKNVFHGISSEIGQNPGKGHEQRDTTCLTEYKEGPAGLFPGKVKYSVGFLTSSQLDRELRPKEQNQEEMTKNVLLKRCDAEKYTFLEKVPQEISLPLADPTDIFNEMLQQTDSNKSFSVSKGDADPSNMSNKDLQTSVSYTTLKKNSASRPHSAETLNFLVKTLKRKYKKRPHCCKRNSIHYIRKNSSKKFEEVVFKGSKENESVRTVKETQSLKLKDAEQEVSGTAEKGVKKEHHANKRKLHIPKLQTNLRKPATAEKKTVRATLKRANVTPRPPAAATAPQKAVAANQRPTTAAPKPAVPEKKPVNDFIKLNKQLAGKYKRTAETKPETKPAKAQPQSKPKPAPPQPVLKPQRKRGKIPIPKTGYHVKSTPQPPAPPENKAPDEKPPPEEQKNEHPDTGKSLGYLKFARFKGSQTFGFRAPFFYSE